MKARYLLLGVVALGLLSCEKIRNEGKIWDIGPVEFLVQVVDANGVDMLNPDNDNSFKINEIKALYGGKEYDCNATDTTSPPTKAYLPRFYGLQVRKTINGFYILRFGELEGAKSYSNEELTLLWGDGSSDIIKFNRKFRWKFNGDPESSEEWFLNGTKVPERFIKIVK